MRKLINFLNIFLCLGFATSAQCDVSLVGYDPNTGDVTLEIINGENCGCNELTSPGTTCDENNPGAVGNNENITHLVFGLHYDDLFENTECTTTNYHPGWTYASIQNFFGGWTNGDIINFNVNEAAWASSWDCILNTEIEDYCWEFVVWQINLSQTVDIIDFPTEYWTDTCGTCANETQIYPDVDLSNNSLVWCPDELPPPPLYPGCMDTEAVNFDNTAGYDDGSCVYPVVPGCMDPVACNYDSNATESDGSCIYCDESLCVWVAPWCYGCTDPVALNYDEDSQINDGTCIYSTGPDLIPINIEVVESYCNENSGLTMFKINVTVTNIGTVDVVEWCGSTFLTPSTWQCPNPNLAPGDTITVEMNFQAEWVSGQSNYFELDFVEGPNGVQEIVTGNNILAGWNMPEFIDCTLPIPGCMDVCALNYNPNANEDDDSCEYYETIIDTIYIQLPPDTIIQTQIDTVITTEYVYITDTITEYITDTVFVDNPIIYGCTWPVSCNYNDEATVDDGSCLDCDTPYEVGEILCDEYHGIDGYWDWWIELKNCGIEPPIEQCDTVYIQLPPDTITVTEIEFIYDTIYIDNYIYEYDTLYLTEYITLTDTITEYIVQEIWIDCNTGLPCEEDPPGIDCPDWTTLHIPNTFTPNNDGFNDTWQIIYDLYCWEDVEFWIYNRWGEEIYHDYGSSFDSYPFWDGSVRGGDYYVADGVYVYIVQGKKVGRAEVVKEQGHITVFR